MKALVTSVLVGVVMLGGWVGTARAQQSTTAALNSVISEVDFEATTAQRAFEWLSIAGGFNLVINWNRLEGEGYSRDTPVDLKLRTVTAMTALRLLAAEVFVESDVIIEINAGYVRILTKLQAQDEPVVKVYDIADLLQITPNFDNAPEFDLNQIVSDTADTGSGGGVFGDVSEDDEPVLPRSERGERIADLIRNNIEPRLWHANGGLGGRIVYYDGRLIIRAPEYVHQKIGMPAIDTAARAPVAPRGGYGYRPAYSRSGDYYRSTAARRLSNGVSGIDWR